MEFTEDYPNKPPKVRLDASSVRRGEWGTEANLFFILLLSSLRLQVRFVTPIFHPNVYVDGSICLDLLQSAWSPIYDVGSVLQSIQSLLSDPNPLSPANAEAASLYQSESSTFIANSA